MSRINAALVAVLMFAAVAGVSLALGFPQVGGGAAFAAVFGYRCCRDRGRAKNRYQL